MESPDPSYQFLACRYLQKQLDVLVKHIDGAREADDPEHVHQARVSSRRLRAGLAMFDDCFAPRMTRKWAKRIKKLTKGLGAARDADVQIEVIEKMLANLEEDDRRHKAGLKRLILRLNQQRQAAQPKVVKAVERLEAGRMLSEMHAELAGRMFELRRSQVSRQSPGLFQRTAFHIRRRLDDMFVYAGSLGDPKDTAGHHQLRIAAKRLRYTLEICNDVYEGELSKFIKSVKKLQTLLGDIHDCDVWVEYVGDFSENERLRTIEFYGHPRPFNRIKPGLAYLTANRQSARNRLFQELTDYWNELQADALADKLLERIDSRINQPEDLSRTQSPDEEKPEDKANTASQ